MPKNIEVSYKNKFCYNILLRRDFGDLTDAIGEIEGADYKKVCIVTDTNVSELYLDSLAKILGEKYNNVLTYAFEAGEKNKQLESIHGLYKKLIEAHFERKDLLIALGGGVVGDMTGFAAATYLRGIDFIQIPTTLLSQVDSSIGGKTGVDFLNYKNMVGAFYMPRLVYMNLSVLDTLPSEQLASGMGEVIKHGIIRNRSYFERLKNDSGSLRREDGSLDPDIIEYIVYESCLVKRAVVEEDPKEQGLRRILNFGHTLGHAIEKLSDFTLFHGQCVALGMVAASYISMSRRLISENEYSDIKDTISSYGLPVSMGAAGFGREDVIAASKSDKKMESGSIRFVLSDGIGNAFVATDVSDEEMMAALNEIMKVDVR